MTTPITGQGLNVCIPPDDELSLTSKKAAQNKVITEELTDLSNAISQLDAEVDVIEKIAVSEVDTSGSVIHIENGIQGAPINLKKLTIEATQSGSGTPSPTNKRPFTGGYQSVNFYVSPTEDQEDATVQQFDLPAGAGTVYRGVIDFEAKKVTVKSVHKKLVGSGNEGISVYTGRRMRVSAPGFSSAGGSTLMPIYSDILKTVTKAAQPVTYAISQSDSGRAELLMSLTASYTTLEAVNEWLQANNVEIDYPLATPLDYTFAEIPQLAMLNGDNYVWSDAGEIDLSYLIEKIVTDIETDQCAFFDDQSYTNVYNPNDPDILINYQIQESDNITAYNGLKVSGYIPCSAGETFMFPVYTSHFGTGSAVYTISMYDASKSFLANVTGTIANDILTITIPSGSSAKYFRVNVCKLNVNSSLIETQYHSASNFMVIKGTTFPDRFYPYEPQVLMDAEIYSSHENLSNPLYTKRAVFLGDSICEGDAKSGWAGRIGMDNTMLWCNRGIGGSTIAITSAGKTICTRSLLMSDPDYIIFEGGTNDADRIGDATGETKPAAFGTWAEDNYGTNDASTYYGFDINTFCGAVDYLCKRLISDYAGAKIGFIGAHKMGTTDSMRANRGYYIHTAMEICKKWGVPVLNLWDNCYLNPLIPAHYTSGQSYLYLDGQHLTANGYEYVTPIIEAWMKTL